MKTVLLSALIAMSLLSGCNSASESSTPLDETTQSETTITPTTSEVEVIVNEAKSPTIVPENQVKTNVSYTHFSASGARY